MKLENRSPYFGGIKRASAVTTIELLATVGTIGILAGVSLFTTTSLTDNVRSSKLETNVSSLNRAIQLYIAGGGNLAEATTPSLVIAALKSSASNDQIIAGYRGAAVDPRLEAVMQSREEAAEHSLRARWDSNSQRFELRKSGPIGVKEFRLNDALATADYGTDERKAINHLALEGTWIWDYDDGAVTSLSPTQVSTADSPGPTSTGTSSSVTQLLPISFNPSGGLFSYFDFPSSVTLSNANDPATTEVYYLINGGAWQLYASALPVSPDDQISAYAAPKLPGSNVYNSFITTEHYQIEQPSLTGTSDGGFKDIIGAAGLVSNIAPGETGARLRYGRGISGADGNELGFLGKSFADIEPGVTFNVGELTYHNSNTATGTSAYEVTLQLDLTFSSPVGTSETVDIVLAIESTPNYPWLSDDQRADYVRFDTVHTDFTAFFGGETYYLNLEFQYSGTDGYSALDAFHVHEGMTATADIKGHFSPIPMHPPDPNIPQGTSGDGQQPVTLFPLP